MDDDRQMSENQYLDEVYGDEESEMHADRVRVYEVSQGETTATANIKRKFNNDALAEGVKGIQCVYLGKDIGKWDEFHANTAIPHDLMNPGEVLSSCEIYADGSVNWIIYDASHEHQLAYIRVRPNQQGG